MKARHHTVPSFLLTRFSRETEQGLRICQLDTASARPKQVSPRDASVRKHFYSLDIDGKRSPEVEDALGLVEQTAAPLIDGLALDRFPVHEHRAELALFMAMSWLRTPAWREQNKSVMEQFMVAGR